MSVPASSPADPSAFSRLMPFAMAAAGVGFLSLMDAFMKQAATETGAYTATVLRALVGAAVIAPIWLWQKRPGPVNRP